MPAEPRGVFCPHRAVGRLDLAVVEDRFAEHDVAVGRPDEVVQRVVGVFAAEAGQQLAAKVGLAIAVGVTQDAEVGFLGNQNAILVEFEGQRDVHVVGPDRTLVGLAVPVGVLEDDDLVVGFLTRDRRADRWSSN